MTEAGWIFQAGNAEAAQTYFDANGFVGFNDLISSDEHQLLIAAVEEAVADGKLTVGAAEIANNNDCVLAHPFILDMVKHPGIVRMVERLTRFPVELQHSKFNAKPVNDLGGGAVHWHQDFPFYPHTNFDLVSCIIHLDDEGEDAGPLRVVNGSHKWGPCSHTDDNGIFAYECTEPRDLDNVPSTLMLGKGGTVSFHHCLTMHSSAPKRRPGHRRYVIFQYRATDAVQVAGVIWQCHGLQVKEQDPAPKYARFPDGTRIELRGVGGKIADLFGQFGRGDQKA